MLVATMTDQNGAMREFEFHTGTGNTLRERIKAKLALYSVSVHRVGKIEIYADGHELESIGNQLVNFPRAGGRSTVWTGEMAWFVVNNVKM